MSDRWRRARAEKLLLGTLVILSAVAAAALAPRAAGQGTAKPKSPDGESSPSDKPKPAATALPEGALRRLGLQPGQPGDPVGHTGGVQSLVFSADGTRLASRGEDPSGPRIRVWDVATGKELLKIDGDELALFTLDGKQLLGRSSPDAKDDEVVLWDATTGEIRSRIPAKELKLARMLPDGKQCVILYGRAEAAYIDLATGKITRTVVAQWGTPLALSRDGVRMACVRGDANRPDLAQGATPLYLADVSAGRDDLCQFRGKQGKVTPGMADFTAEPLDPQNRLTDERLLAAGGWDNTIHLWDAKPTQLRDPRLILKGHTGRVLRVAFSPDGRFLVSAGMDRTVRIWDLLTEKEVAQLAGHAEYVTALAFSPDGRYLATGGNFRDRSIVLWDFWKLVLNVPEATPLPSEEQVQVLWNNLASDAPAGASLTAVATLTTAPAEATRLIKRQIDPYVQEAQKDRILELLKQLDDNQFAVREAATEALIRLRRQAEGLLRTALRETRSPEVHFRLRRVLSQGNSTPSISPAEVRRYRRAVLLLERIASADARKLLEHLSEVFPSPEVNRDAREALARLRLKAGA